jgi:ABC-2 type transport system permease protein
MKKIALIIRREYVSRVRKKSFIVMTILGPLLFAALMFGAIVVTLSDSTEYDVLIVDEFGVITEYGPDNRSIVPRYPERFAEEANLRYTFTKEPQSPEGVFARDIST